LNSNYIYIKYYAKRIFTSRFCLIIYILIKKKTTIHKKSSIHIFSTSVHVFKGLINSKIFQKSTDRPISTAATKARGP
jgi:hypothetical protein